MEGQICHFSDTALTQNQILLDRSFISTQKRPLMELNENNLHGDPQRATKLRREMLVSKQTTKRKKKNNKKNSVGLQLFSSSYLKARTLFPFHI